MTKYGSSVSPHLPNGPISSTTVKATLSSIHSETVLQVIDDLGPNALLGVQPPPIDRSEKALSRVQRCTLSQLRSGFCHLLEDYRHRVGRSPHAVCPECLFRRHTVPHLFDCPAAPTDFVVLDLWRRPADVVGFLLSLPSFASLLPPSPPLPPPPPEPPPLPRPPPHPPAPLPPSLPGSPPFPFLFPSSGPYPPFSPTFPPGS